MDPYKIIFHPYVTEKTMNQMERNNALEFIVKRIDEFFRIVCTPVLYSSKKPIIKKPMPPITPWTIAVII